MKKGAAASHVYQLKVRLCDIDVIFDEANGTLIAVGVCYTPS
jgi:hypothetical protein